jgi:hypothetical protein
MPDAHSIQPRAVAASAAEQNRKLVADELAGTVGEDRWGSRQAPWSSALLPTRASLLDEHTGLWGIKVTMVDSLEVFVQLLTLRPAGKQAEAEREKRAKIIHA